MTATIKRGCYCSHCKRSGLGRDEMTVRHGIWLCSACNKLTYIHGTDPAYADPYYRQNPMEKHVVSDADASPAAPPAKRGRNEARSRFREWRRDVRRASLPGLVKDLLWCVSERADYSTGTNAWPELATIAEDLGWTVKRVRWAIQLAVKAEWITIEHRRAGGRRTSNRYVFRWPDGRTVAVADQE